MADEQVKYTPEDLKWARDISIWFSRKYLEPKERPATYSVTEMDAVILEKFAQVRREERQKAERLAEAAEYLYRYFVMPGHAAKAKDCPNKDCPFCRWDAALADFRKGQANG